MDQKENLLDKDLSLVVVLPGGEEMMTTVHGSKPLMDLLVTLCAKYHLNPSSHTLELVAPNKKTTKLKPNALIGTLEAEKIILKPKGEDKNKKTGPQMPEATVRMVINYKKTQKTILRVSPRVPLSEHLPAICEKCEFDIETTILLRDVQSLAPLDLSSSLNDYAIREVYARDTKALPTPTVCPASPTHAVVPGKDKNQKEEENKGLFSKFRKSKKKSDQATTASAPASPVLVSKPRPLSMALPSSNSSPLHSPSVPTDVPKKRRAPQPPILVSQSSSSEPSLRQRLGSEPDAQVDRDQIGGLSRGSSAESSLKRTKRKAPPPPTPPSAVVPETIPPDEDLQGGTAANTLGEIVEQEETAASVTSGTASDNQGEDGSLNMSADVSLHSPSPDTDVVSTVSAEDNGEDQSADLSSDGNQLQSSVIDGSAASDVRTADGAGSSELAVTNGVVCEAEEVSQQPIYEESTPENGEDGCSTVTSSLPPPVMQDAEAQTSVQANSETPGEQTEEQESAVAVSTSRPAGEDAQVQTDFTPVAEAPQQQQQHTEKVPSAAAVPALESEGKRDMATLTEEPNPPDFKQTVAHTSETSSCQDSAASAPAAAKASAIYATNSEPKPKPSNELTRDYIPKVGMTTYTIMPQKSLEKLRYFEVALTLEAPATASEEGLDVASLQLEEKTAAGEQTEDSKEDRELHSTTPREDVLTSTNTTTSTPTTTTIQNTVNGSIPESIRSSSPQSLPKAEDKISSLAEEASQAGSPTKVKEMKIPPATKPKPGSFRLAQHKKTPGYYVTSAAEKSVGASPGSGQRETQGSADRAQLPPPPLPPPPPPPPGFCDEETTGGADVELSPKEVDKDVSVKRMTRQSSLPCREQSLGLSLEKLRSFAAPRPYTPTTPSRFAQAVSSAVRRSQSLSHRPTLPPSPASKPLSPITSCSAVVESEGLPVLQDNENGAENNDSSTQQGTEDERPALGGNVQMEEESCP